MAGGAETPNPDALSIASDHDPIFIVMVSQPQPTTRAAEWPYEWAAPW
jgi:hypothetical protein